MELLLQREADLKMSWHPGCMHIGGKDYAVGEIGRTGPGSPKDAPDWKTPSVPSSVSFTITANNQELHDSIVAVLRELEKTDQIKVNAQMAYNTKTKIKTKDQFVELEKIVTEANNKITQRVTELCHELELLGCSTDDLGCAKYTVMPADCFEWETKTNYGNICVYSHSGTQFYQFLNSNGLLEKHFPEWYRNGNF